MPDRKYLSLQEATKHMPFDSNYLGLLIRKGWLFGVKKKGRWYTTKEAIDEYMKKSARVKVPEKKPWMKFLFTQIGIGSFFFIVLLLFGTAVDAFFFEDAKRDVVQSPTLEAWSSSEKSSALISEKEAVSSLLAVKR